MSIRPVCAGNPMAKLIPIPVRRAAQASSRVEALVRDMRARSLRSAPDGTIDTRGRPLRDLRISVTDRCNFRCVYCMPKDVFGRDYPFLPHDELLTFEEIARLARLFKAQGVVKVRLTGGEPLLRKNIERLIEMLAAISGLDLTLTTNGALLARKAQSLKDAGLERVTVSLDALDDSVFRTMNDVDFPVERVLEGIDAAAAAGLAPIKLNAVIKRSTNEREILPLARHFRGSGHILRFIEYMDVGHTNGWRMDEVVPAAEVLKTIDAEFPIEPIDPNYPGEVADRDCTRARLSTDGKVYTCLFGTEGFDLKTPLRAGASDDALGDAIAAIWRQRADRYSELRTAATGALPKVEMSYIGG